MPNPYIRTIRSVDNQHAIEVDVYNVLAAFRVDSPPIQHAIKKLLCPGQRGAKPVVQDLREAIQAIERAIVMEGGEMEPRDEIALKEDKKRLEFYIEQLRTKIAFADSNFSCTALCNVCDVVRNMIEDFDKQGYAK